jgi:hypothetical protein
MSANGLVCISENLESSEFVALCCRSAQNLGCPVAASFRSRLNSLRFNRPAVGTALADYENGLIRLDNVSGAQVAIIFG